jgi:RNA recognition motif-containing protein
MGKTLYVGNLGSGVSNGDLAKLFETHGTVASARIILDRETGRSRGFGFVEMGTDQEAQTAMAALHGRDSDGRTLAVKEARLKAEGGRDGPGKGQNGYGSRVPERRPRLTHGDSDRPVG